MKQNPNKSSEKKRERRPLGNRHGRACHPRTAVRGAHGWPCVQARPVVRPVVPFGAFCPGCTAVRWSCSAPFCYILDARDVLEPPIFLEIARELLFSIEI